MRAAEPLCGLVTLTFHRTTQSCFALRRQTLLRSPDLYIHVSRLNASLSLKFGRDPQGGRGRIPSMTLFLCCQKAPVQILRRQVLQVDYAKPLRREQLTGPHRAQRLIGKEYY